MINIVDICLIFVSTENFWVTFWKKISSIYFFYNINYNIISSESKDLHDNFKTIFQLKNKYYLRIHDYNLISENKK